LTRLEELLMAVMGRVEARTLAGVQAIPYEHLVLAFGTRANVDLVPGLAEHALADDLGLSTRTVETHRAHIMEKMGATSLSHLVRMAVAVMPEVGVRAPSRGSRGR
jgi:NADH dehydrogenase FAD-containing subunit